MKLTTENISARLDSTEVCATLSNPLADSLDYWPPGRAGSRHILRCGERPARPGGGQTYYDVFSYMKFVKMNE